MIERILRMQTIDGPYLGKSAPTAQPATSMAQHLAKAAVPGPTTEPLKLQSLGQQLHIQSAQKQIKQQKVHMQKGVQSIAQQTLQPTTLQAIKGGGLHSLLALSPQELLLLAALRAKHAPTARTADQWVPHVSAQLSFIETPRQFLRTLPRAKSLRLKGLSFIRFRFDWERDAEREREDDNVLE